MTIYLLCFALFLVGLYGVLTKRDLIKVILSLTILGYSVNLLFVVFGYRAGATYPILTRSDAAPAMVDPLPQALVLTSIVIELGTTVLLAALALRLFQRYGTFDVTEMRRLRG